MTASHAPAPERTIELTATLASVEDGSGERPSIHLSIDGDNIDIRIDHGGGRVVMPLADFDTIAAELRAYRHARRAIELKP